MQDHAAVGLLYADDASVAFFRSGVQIARVPYCVIVFYSYLCYFKRCSADRRRIFDRKILMAENRMIRVGITQGDVNGIGPEVIIKTLADPRMSELFVPVVYGSSKVFSYYRKGLPEGETFSFQITGSAREARPKRVNLVETGTGEVRIEPGTATREGGAEAVNALRRAADDLAAGDIDVVVTAPINKENVQEAGFGFTGHTEFFADRFGGEPLMVM